MQRWLAVSVALGAVALLAAGGALGAPPLYDDRFFEPVPDVVTPHVTWVKPGLGAPPKVLFITHRNAMREVIELRQRMAMDYDIFAYDGADSFGETGIGVDASWRLIRGNSFDEQAERLRSKLKQPHDVIVVGGVRWDAMPIDCRYEILKQVKAGTGLVGSLSGQDEYLGRIMKDAAFAWHWAVWSGGAQGITDFFGVGEYEGSVDYGGGHSGDAALKITCASAVAGSRETPRGGYNVPVTGLEPGAGYVFSFWSRTAGLAAGGARVSLYPVPADSVVPASDGWTYNERRFTAAEGQTECGVYLLLYEPGTVWYDDVKLTRVGSDQNLLPNPGFEHPGPAPAVLAAGVPWQALPAFSASADQEAFLRSAYQVTSFGKGRVGLISYGVAGHQMLTPGPSGPLQDCRLDYDYYLAAAIRLILWGANRDPAVSVTSAQPLLTMDRATLAAGPAFFTVATPTPLADGRMLLTIRDRHGRVWHREGGTFNAAAAREIGPSAARLPRGDFMADLWIKSGNRIAGFGSVGLNITDPVSISAFTLANPHLPQNQSLRGAVTTEGDVSGYRLRLRVRDFYGREVTARTVPVSGPETAFSVALPPMLSITGRLEAELVQDDDIRDVQQRSFSVTDRYADRQDVQFVMWMDYPEDFIGPLMAEEFTRNGIDAQYGGSLGYAPYANQWWLPYMTRFTDAKTDWYQLRPTREAGDLVRDPCLTNPDYREAVKAELVAKAKMGLDYSTSDFTLGDENMFVAGDWDLCFSDTCNADFRRWAQEAYGSLEALNASWGSDFSDWEAVKPRTLAECKEDGSLVPWVDHRLHMESVWAGMHSFSRDAIREVVPQARVGYEGSDTTVGSYSAADYWKLSQAMDLNNIYYRDFLTLAWRDFVTPQTLLGAGWFGGYPGNRNAPFMRWFPWRALLKGSNSFWVWAGYGHPGAVMAYDVSLYPFFQQACQEVGEIKAGPGKLLMGAQRQHDGIALLWSASSVHLATATPGFPDMDGTLQGAVQVLHDVGLEARVLSYEELAKGELTTDEFRVLVLPGSQALSDTEVAGIRSFFAAGGTVIADLRPGVTDEHGKPRSPAALDDLFGIVQGPAFRRIEGNLELAGAPETSGSSLSFAGLVADGSLAVGAGRALGKLGETPVMVASRIGRGRSMLLNFSLRSYLSLPRQSGPDFPGWAEGLGYRTVVRGLMKACGVTPAVTVTPESPQVEISRFREGVAEYVGIVQGLPRDPLEYTNRTASVPPAHPITINFGRTAHLYDVRTGKYLGQRSTLDTQMAPGVAQLYALLPYRVTGLSGYVTPRARGGEALTYAFRVQGAATPASHVLRLTFTGPDGRERPYYARNVRTGADGRLEGTLHLAVDDQPGRWQATARDVATGTSQTVSFTVAN